jgi:tryptophan halogenase
MEICIIGSGVSGLMCAIELKKINAIKKINIISSNKIPSIKVGESTTYPFYTFINNNFDLKEFITNTDASVKYGVYYKNWSKRNFIHFFTPETPFERYNTRERPYCELLANKDPNIHFHSLLGNKLWKYIHKNQVCLNDNDYRFSWHFDAAKFKKFLISKLKNNSKINFIEDTIKNCIFGENKKILYISGENNKKYIADYFVNCCGENYLNEVFGDKYISLSPYLLTNRALVYPLKFTNKKDQFHPYTVAKTMKYGWRWITPTQTRIGTGYVFSDNHISVDQATHEFLEDIGDKTIAPQLVNFNPRINQNIWKSNYCSIGMSSGFLEPLDAPGLAMTVGQIGTLISIIEKIDKINQNIIDKKELEIDIKNYNFRDLLYYQWWCSFILLQYKTCWRNDTQFWIDHKNVFCDFFESIIKTLEYPNDELFDRYEYEMFFKTIAAKDIKWKSKIKHVPYKIEQQDSKTIHHLEYIENFYK